MGAKTASISGGDRSLDRPRNGLFVLDRGLQRFALLLSIACIAAVAAQSGAASVATIFFNRDALWLLAYAALLACLSFVRPAAGWVRASAWSWRSAWALAVMVATAAVIGRHLVFRDHALTQDETMAQFDAAIFRSGHLVATIPDEWRPFADALEPRFVTPIAGHLAWVSAYLPGNAALRAALDGLLGFDLASAILAGVAIVAVGGVARTLWPHRPDAAFVAALLLATSPQFLFTAATPFAMTAHLAVDLVWLWLFLRGGAFGHGGAVAVTLLGCGLHQIVFHPLFAGPFVLQLWIRRRWRLAALYTFAFAASALFWILYWQILLAYEGLRGTAETGAGIAGFARQVTELLAAFSWSGLDLMSKNIARFMAWQNPIALALAFIGIGSLWKIRASTEQTPVARETLVALAAGLALTLVAMFILLPNQGFGWGYRYVHGLLGSFCLIAAWGWIVVSGDTGMDAVRRKAWGAVYLGSLFTIAIVVPARAIEIGRFVRPYAEAERDLRASRTDLVFVDANGSAYTTALVRNDPFLHNWPKLLDLSRLTPEQVETLCATHDATLFDSRDAQAYGILRTDKAPASAQEKTLLALGCAKRLAPHPDR